MTEAEWNNCNDPGRMLAWLRRSPRATDRKLRLFACICARLVWAGLQDWGTPDEDCCRNAITSGESYADGLIPEEVLDESRAQVSQLLQGFRNAEAMLPDADDLKARGRAAQAAAAVLEKSGARAA